MDALKLIKAKVNWTFKRLKSQIELSNNKPEKLAQETVKFSLNDIIKCC